MIKKASFWVGLFFWMMIFSLDHGFTQEDKVVQVAIDHARTQFRVPRDLEIKFLDKMESQIPGFLAVRLLILAPDREVPIIVYVDPAGEKVITGQLFIKGENVTRKEAGEPKPRRIDMEQLEIEKSPSRGAAGAKVTIVEFSNFECPHCVRSWAKMKELLGKHPQDLKYVFKHFPLQRQGKAFDLSAMVAAVQNLNPEAFWMVHDFLYTDEGQAIIKLGTEPVKKKVEQILQEKGYNAQVFLNALETGNGKKRVEEDLAVVAKIRIRGTPTVIINGSFVIPPNIDKMVEEQLKK